MSVRDSLDKHMNRKNTLKGKKNLLLKTNFPPHTTYIYNNFPLNGNVPIIRTEDRQYLTYIIFLKKNKDFPRGRKGGEERCVFWG